MTGYRIAWRGITGYLLALLGCILAFTAARPLNGATLAGVVLVIVGAWLVGTVIAPAMSSEGERAGARHGRRSEP